MLADMEYPRFSNESGGGNLTEEDVDAARQALDLDVDNIDPLLRPTNYDLNDVTVYRLPHDRYPPQLCPIAQGPPDLAHHMLPQEQEPEGHWNSGVTMQPRSQWQAQYNQTAPGSIYSQTIQPPSMEADCVPHVPHTPTSQTAQPHNSYLDPRNPYANQNVPSLTTEWSFESDITQWSFEGTPEPSSHQDSVSGAVVGNWVASTPGFRFQNPQNPPQAPQAATSLQPYSLTPTPSQRRRVRRPRSRISPVSQRPSSSHTPAASVLRAYICDRDDCSAAFEDAQGLRHHNRNAHTQADQRPYPCLEPNCEKRFMYPKDLTRHRRTHRNAATVSPTGTHEERHYCRFRRCKYATRGFDRKDHFDRHMASVHQMSDRDAASVLDWQME